MHGRGNPEWWLGVFALLLAAVATAGCEFPRDPRGTLEQVRGGTMREVAVERVDHTAVLLGEEGAVPDTVEDLSSAEIPVAAYPWQLEAWGHSGSSRG